MCTYKRDNCFNSFASNSSFLAATVAAAQIDFTWNANTSPHFAFAVYKWALMMASRWIWNKFSLRSHGWRSWGRHRGSVNDDKVPVAVVSTKIKINFIKLRLLQQRSSIKQHQTGLYPTGHCHWCERSLGNHVAATRKVEWKRMAINVRVYDGDNYVLRSLLWRVNSMRAHRPFVSRGTKRWAREI